MMMTTTKTTVMTDANNDDALYIIFLRHQLEFNRAVFNLKMVVFIV